MTFEFAQALLIAVLGFGPPAARSGDGECGCPESESRVWVAIDKDVLTLSHQSELPASFRDSIGRGAIVVGCRRLQSEAASGSGHTGIRLHCEDVEFHTGRGIHGRAARLSYDSSSKKLELHGTEGQPVQVAWESAPGDETRLVAQDMRVDLKESRFRMHGAGALEWPCALEVPMSGCGCRLAGCCLTAKPGEACGTDAPAILPAAAVNGEERPRVWQFDVFQILR
ncbi:MAG TPA: hypothetical protein VML55_26915 [Planctomycetaceae bacterium]|nr:hypothetical protein [Planctomycetaceae bacterium]